MSPSLEQLAAECRHLTAAIPREPALPATVTVARPRINKALPRGLELRIEGLESMARSMRKRADRLRDKLDELHRKALALDAMADHIAREIRQARDELRGYA